MKLFNFVDFRELKQCGRMTERSRLFTGYTCNIKCEFCFYKGRKNKHDMRMLTLQQLASGKQYGIKDWDISGGEPSIISYWFDLLETMKEMGFRNIACITNGYKFANNGFLVDSMEAGLNELLFSFHGAEKRTHDEMTKIDGSFKAIQEAICNSIREGMIIRINVVVTNRNYKELPEIAKYMNEMVNPTAFNFLPFRMENSATKENMVKYTDIVPYIKEAIDILDKDTTKVTVRYVPFCLFEGYEQYVAGYLQREFDEYEWNEYTIRKFDEGIRNGNIPDFDYESDKWDLEINALHKSIKHVANHSTKCLACKYLHVCDGIWYSYGKVWGAEEFKPIRGDKTECISLNC